MSLASILTYKDYRVYLKDLYALRKKEKGRYSYRAFSEDMGFKASNFMHLVLKGQRNLSEEAVAKIVRQSSWSSQEKKYFGHLVQFNQAKDKDQKKQHAQVLESLQVSKRKLLKGDQFSYFGNWYIPVIREILPLKRFVANLNWIAKFLRPRIEEQQAKDALKILERLKMVKKQGSKWVQNDEHVTTEMQVTSDMLLNYHEEQLKLSARSLELPGSKRDVSAMTMSVSKKRFDWLKSKVIAFRDEIQQEIDEENEDPTMVCQLNIQLFPVTKD